MAHTCQPVRVRAGALEIACVEWGRAGDPTVVLLHGNGGHARWWDVLVPHLVPGWRVVTPHLRGHGESDWAEPPAYRLSDYARDVAAVLDARAPQRVVLGGHSMGGRIALAVAAAHPERIAGLVVLDSRLEPVDRELAARYRGHVADLRQGRRHPSREAAIAAFRFVPPEPGVDPAVVRRLAEHAIVERGPGDWAFRFDRGVLTREGDRAGDLHRLLERLACPVFVGAGEDSWVMGPTECRRIAEAIPTASIRVYPGAHHFLLRCPERLGPDLRAFLDGLERTR